MMEIIALIAIILFVVLLPFLWKLVGRVGDACDNSKDDF